MTIKIIAVYNVEADSLEELTRMAEAYGAEEVELQTPVDAATYMVNSFDVIEMSPKINQVSVRIEETDGPDLF